MSAAAQAMQAAVAARHPQPPAAVKPAAAAGSKQARSAGGGCQLAGRFDCHNRTVAERVPLLPLLPLLISRLIRDICSRLQAPPLAPLLAVSVSALPAAMRRPGVNRLRAGGEVYRVVKLNLQHSQQQPLEQPRASARLNAAAPKLKLLQHQPWRAALSLPLNAAPVGGRAVMSAAQRTCRCLDWGRLVLPAPTAPK